VVLVALLYEKSDTSLRAGNDTDGLFQIVSINLDCASSSYFASCSSRVRIVGMVRGVVPCWRSGPHSVTS
jgi:hypothetical protein